MKTTLILILVTMLTLGSSTVINQNPVQIDNPQTIHVKTQTDILNDIARSVVQVRVYLEDNPDKPKVDVDDIDKYFLPRPIIQPVCLGTGFMIEPLGYLVTNHHVVEHGNRFFVILPNKTEIEAKLIGVDAVIDVAVLYIPKRYCTSLAWGDSTEMKVGDVLYAFGSPLRVQESITRGIVSNPRFFAMLNQTVIPYIQTDADINPGNSGGPLFNEKGQVVGVNNWIMSSTGASIGLGFAIPGNLAHAAVNNILATQNRENHATWLGVIIDNSYGSADGVIINGIVTDSPADLAGLHIGDRITHLQGNKIDSIIIFETILKNLYNEYKITVRVDGLSESVDIIKSDKPVTINNLVVKNNHDYLTRDNEERLALFNDIASHRRCACESGQNLLHCDDCTMVKNDLRYLINLINKGLSKTDICRLMDAPVVISVWVDLSDNKSIELYKNIKELTTHIGIYARVHIRHYPGNFSKLPDWKERANSYEIMRAINAEDQFIDTMYSENQLTRFLKVIGLSVDKGNILNYEYNMQLNKDAYEGEQLGVLLAPAITINNDLYSNISNLRLLQEHIYQLVLNKSL